MIRQFSQMLTFCAALPVVGFSTLALAQTELNVNESTSAELHLKGKAGLASNALLLNTDISGEVNGMVATITLRQTFKNPSTDWVNGEYVFPLPDKAAVDSLSLETDGRLIHGVVKEKQQAKQAFDAAKNSGKKAGLLVQRRPNLFSMSLANIAPQSEVIATVTWVETVRFNAGQFSLRLPTTLTPRFIPGQPLDNLIASLNNEVDFQKQHTFTIDSAHGWAQNTDEVPDASSITPFQTVTSPAPSSHQFSLKLTLDPGIEISTVNSVSHAINNESNKADGNSQTIQLLNGTALMDRDFIINWSPSANALPDAAVFQQTKGDEKYSLLMLMPPMRNIVQTLPRDVTFIIDSSGSMAGVSMPQAKQGLLNGLSYLSATDRFNIIDFDDEARGLFPQSVRASSHHLALADRFISGLEADGGTNMESALKLAFSQTQTEGLLRQIIFITDGSVGNEQALFKQIRAGLGDARLFTVGIGSAPNSHFMRGAAKYGRGSYEFIDSLDQAAVQMNTLFTKINRPVMRNIEVDWGSSKLVEIYPQKVPDLYIGEPLMVLAKSAGETNEVHIKGELAGKAWNTRVIVSNAPNSQNLDKLWAREKIHQLQSQQVLSGQNVGKVKSNIMQLGIDHQLVTAYTSFIAVEEAISKPAQMNAKEKSVVNLMPKGNAMFVPNTATPAALMILIGSIMSLMGAGLLRPSLASTIMFRLLMTDERKPREI